MATSDRDTVYNADGTKKTVYDQDYNSSTGWVVGGIIVVALVVIAYFVFSGHPATTPSGADTNSTPAVTAPATPGPAADKAATPSTSTTPSTNATPMTTPATPAPATATPATPATAPAAPATTPATPATSQ